MLAEGASRAAVLLPLILGIILVTAAWAVLRRRDLR
jgi:hypothetical protein